MEKKILINTKSYGRIDRAPNENLRSYLKEINVKSSNKKNRSIIKSNVKKKKNFNIDSSRNLKTSENENKNNIYNNINIDDAFNKYNIKIVPEKKEEIDENNNNNEEKIINLKKSIESNHSRNIGKNEEGKFMENLKSEEEKKYIISTSSNNIIKNNNFFNKQFSDKPVNCISEEEVDSKNKILVSKLEIDSGNTKLIKNERENSQKKLPTENDELIKGLENKNNIITDSENSKTSKLIDEKSENNINKKKENNNHEIIKINNKLNEKNVINPNDNNNINLNEMKIKEKEKEEGKQNIIKIKNELKGKNENPDDFINIKPYQSVTNKRWNLYRKCSICENNFPISKLFVPSCELHYLCRHCSKYYIEDIIENGIKEINCPFIKCKKPFDKNDLKDIISSHHLNLLKNDNSNLIEESNIFYYNQKKENDDEGNANHYSKKNVIDINTNKKLYNYKSTKVVVCSNCNMESLFSKANAHFLKCLYCTCKKCKYCLKNYDDEHMDINSPTHCKVYYRYERKDLNKSEFCLRLFLQFFFVIACYILCFASSFIKIRSVFYFVFRAKKTGNVILYIFAYFFTIYFFIIIIPFYIIFYPFFPCIMSCTDY